MDNKIALKAIDFRITSIKKMLKLISDGGLQIPRAIIREYDARLDELRTLREYIEHR